MSNMVSITSAHTPEEFENGGFTAAWLAQLVERRTAVREVEVQAPDRTNTQGLKITEENVLPL